MIVSPMMTRLVGLLTVAYLSENCCKSVTELAQAIVQESNFKLQSPISTQDEVGSLATSLNQLIQWVGEHTEALEQSRQTQ